MLKDGRASLSAFASKTGASWWGHSSGERVREARQRAVHLVITRDRVSVGIDVAEARKGLDLVALDTGRNIVESHARLTVDEVGAIVTSLHRRLCASTRHQVGPCPARADSPSGNSRLSAFSRTERAQIREIIPSTPGSASAFRSLSASPIDTPSIAEPM